MYTVSIYLSGTCEHYSGQYASLNAAIIAAIDAETGIDSFEIALGAARGHYVGQCDGLYLTIAALH